LNGLAGESLTAFVRVTSIRRSARRVQLELRSECRRGLCFSATFHSHAKAAAARMCVNVWLSGCFTFLVREASSYYRIQTLTVRRLSPSYRILNHNRLGDLWKATKGFMSLLQAACVTDRCYMYMYKAALVLAQELLCQSMTNPCG
jgi:hypothetical protein